MCIYEWYANKKVVSELCIVYAFYAKVCKCLCLNLPAATKELKNLNKKHCNCYSYACYASCGVMYYYCDAGNVGIAMLSKL